MLEQVHFFFAGKLTSPQALADMEDLIATVLGAEEYFERERAQALAEGGQYKRKRRPSYARPWVGTPGNPCRKTAQPSGTKPPRRSSSAC